MKKSILLIFIPIMLAICLAGCGSGDDGSGGTIYTAISRNPGNLDPQLADDRESASVICNIFEGLTKLSDSGEISLAAAEDYTVSDDMLTYTFTIHEGMVWKGANGFTAEVTADDFVYAFRRIFDPDMQSPYREEFSALKNSEAVYSGIMSPADLGVRAADKRTVIFTLDYPVSDFLYLLSTAAAMPCCEEFFLSTGGRYGLSAEYTAGNGAFTLTEWNYDPYWNENYLLLKRTNENSTSQRRTYPSAVRYIITSDTAEYEEESGDTIDCRICGAGKLPRMRGRKSGEYPCASVGVTFNSRSEIFSNYNIRRALSVTADVSVYKGKTSAGISVSRGVIPSAVTLKGKSVRELLGEVTLSGQDGAELWNKGIAETGGNYPELATIIIPESFADASIVYMLTDSWNEELGFSCGTEILSDKEYSERIDSGDYMIALTVITSDKASAADFLEQYLPYVMVGSDREQLEAYIAGGRYGSSVNDELHNYGEGERLIIENGYFIPVFYQSDFLVTGDDISGVVYDPFTGAADFKGAKKFGG